MGGSIIDAVYLDWGMAPGDLALTSDLIRYKCCNLNFATKGRVSIIYNSAEKREIPQVRYSNKGYPRS